MHVYVEQDVEPSHVQAEKNAEKQVTKVQAQLAIVETERDNLKAQLKQVRCGIMSSVA